jgi:hypothetical protein
MRNIFELTKREQRVVIAIVTLLVAFAFAKHWRQNATQNGSTRLKPTPAATSGAHHTEDASTNNPGA